MILAETDIKSIVQSGRICFVEGSSINFSYTDDFNFKSHSRNSLIFGFFNQTNMVEQVGSGIYRIKNLMKKAALSEPIFKTEGMFTIVFMKKKKEKTVAKVIDFLEGDIGLSALELSNKVGSKLAENQLKILLLLSESSHVTKSKLSVLLKISTTAVDKHISKLKEYGLLKRMGSDKSGYWEVTNNLFM